MSDRIPPLTATEIVRATDMARTYKDGTRGVSSSNSSRFEARAMLLGRALRYAIQQSQEPSEAEIETVARALARDPAGFLGYEIPWRRFTDEARVAIRAIRGLDAEATP